MKDIFRFIWHALLKPLLEFLFMLVIVIVAVAVFITLCGFIIVFSVESVGAAFGGSPPTPLTPYSPAAGWIILTILAVGILAWIGFGIQSLYRFFRKTWRRIKNNEDKPRKSDWPTYIK